MCAILIIDSFFSAATWKSGGGFAHLPSSYLPSAFLPALPLSGKRKRRHRTIFSEEQLAELEATFQKTHYPDVLLREQLAQKTDLKEERVEVIFSNNLLREQLREQLTMKTT